MGEEDSLPLETGLLEDATASSPFSNNDKRSFKDVEDNSGYRDPLSDISTQNSHAIWSSINKDEEV